MRGKTRFVRTLPRRELDPNSLPPINFEVDGFARQLTSLLEEGFSFTRGVITSSNNFVPVAGTVKGSCQITPLGLSFHYSLERKAMNYDDESLWIAMLMDDEQKLMMKEMVFEIL